MVTRRERAGLLALVCDVYCENHNKHTFPFGIRRQVWYLIVPITDPCCLSYFDMSQRQNLKTKWEICRFLKVFSTQLQSFGLAAHKNSTCLNLALAVSVCLLASMGASFDFKCAYD